MIASKKQIEKLGDEDADLLKRLLDAAIDATAYNPSAIFEISPQKRGMFGGVVDKITPKD